jgi:hypothetical protein
MDQTTKVHRVSRCTHGRTSQHTLGPFALVLNFDFHKRLSPGQQKNQLHQLINYRTETHVLFEKKNI